MSPGYRYLVIVVAAAALTVLFVTNRRYVYTGSLGALPALTAAHIADPRHSGATFRLEGRVTSVGVSRQGIVFIEMYEPAEDMFIDVPVFPSLGCLPVKPRRGETLRVTGNLGMYSGQPQLRPLSAAHVTPTAPRGDPVSMAEAAARIGATLLVGPVIAVETEHFESQAGLEHVRLTLADAEDRTAAPATVAGIMFEGERTPCEVDRLLSDDPFLVTAEVELFQDAPSLNVRRVFAPGAW